MRSENKLKRVLAIILLASVPFASAEAVAAIDFSHVFADRDACFLMVDLKTGHTVAEHNPQRCKERFSPCSSYKIAAAVMGFDNGVIKDENQVVKWDGIKRDRPELNQDQTPLTWMKESVKWVTEWVMAKLGEKNIQKYLDGFSYGNKDFSEGLKDAWVISSLKISAQEQVAFLSKLWKDELPVSKRSMELTRKIIFVKSLKNNFELYGKTGTGCLVGHDCMDRPDKMLGWFVGAVKAGSQTYIFAANASDLKPQGPPGGPRVRKTVIEILEQMELASK